LSGTIDYYSYWGKTPECIVVSVNQNYLDSSNKSYLRWSDCDYSWQSGYPRKKGILFKDFINNELIPYIDKNYRTTSFKTIIGHSFTANYINFFLFDQEILFNAYISISPYYAKNSLDSLYSVLSIIKKPIYYFVAVGEKDLSGHIKSVNHFNKKFSKIKNSNFKYGFYQKKDNATHATIVNKSIPYAIEHIFEPYGAIFSKAQYKTLKKSDSSLNFLLKKYQFIKDVYGIILKIRLEDIETTFSVMSKKKEWDSMKTLGELALKLYPNEYIGYWIIAELEEHNKNYNSSLDYYNKGIEALKNSDCLNIEDFMKDVNRVKKKLK
jgi:hypothetical protein